MMLTFLLFQYQHRKQAHIIFLLDRVKIQLMLINCFLLLIVFSSSFVFGGDEFEDYRCKCVCPSFTVLNDPTVNETNRRVYVDVVPPDYCTCQRVVFRTIKATPAFQDRFCPR